jgi:acetoin utilization deacetylase AcuC-like enzyme
MTAASIKLFPDPHSAMRPMRAYYTDPYPLPLPPGHRFPHDKYARLRDRVSALALADLVVPPPASDADLARVHHPEYVAAVTHGRLSAAAQRLIGFPWSPQLVERSRRSVGATLAACRTALTDGVAVTLAGGTHHAFPDHGEGFCVFNDVAVAVRALQVEGVVRRVLIVDCDVHQGNGTAAMFAGAATVYTLDLFAEHNYPFRKVPADLPIALPDGTGDDEYLCRLCDGLPRALDASRPDLAVYVSGADAFHGDRLGRLALTRRGLAERDRLVMASLQQAGVPFAVAMAGGYGRDIDDTVAIHLETVRSAVASLTVRDAAG